MGDWDYEEMEKILDERIDEVTEKAYAKGKASAQAEIAAMSAGLVKAHDAFIEGDMDEVYHQIYTLMVAHDVHNPAACKNFIAKHKGR